MKRGAEAMSDAGSERSNRDGNRHWRRPSGDHKRMRRTDERRTGDSRSRSQSTTTSSPKVRTLADEKETDPHRLAQRQKQIDYGKNTIGYDRYCAQVPRHARRPGKHPMTPDKTARMGKKVFDGVVRKWRQALHKYDPPELTETIKNAQLAPASDTTTGEDASRATKPEADASVSGVPAESVVEKNLTPISGASKEESPPSRSIYENFDEDNFDEDDSDDDLL
ncbi:hypothetical protein PHYBOEH_000499 [Phytophthora boehmeriae]|uniref:Histone RNA hairpin-binding protein RNA-binding domain-containing protein n=1 Tax=Phytophthora boehmeriae TaxID=109152 RepID=A0A8T1WVU1_9STRA|nr:hypothetical protein PHYBOEH_000499 [Phytophthora boehmeriae]